MLPPKAVHTDRGFKEGLDKFMDNCSIKEMGKGRMNSNIMVVRYFSRHLKCSFKPSEARAF